MKILVAIDAPIENYSSIKKKISKYDLVIAADGAARHLKKLSIVPNIIIGDFDSLKTIPKEWKKVKLIKYPKEKNITDGELAINLAVKKQPATIDIIGLTGGNLAHTLANIELLKLIPHKIEVTLFSDTETTYRLTSSKTIKAKIGGIISLINFFGTPRITTSGLKYELLNSTLKTPSHGISNIALKKEVKIKLENKGVVLVLIYSIK